MLQEVVLIAEPLAALRRYAKELVTQACQREMTFVEATDAVSAVELSREHNPGLVVLEIAMNGVQAAAQIWREQPQTRIMFWTQFHRDIFMRELRQLVADQSIYAYVLKDSSEDKLLHAIASIWLHHNPYIDGSIRRQMLSGNHGTKLNEREFEVLQDMACGLTEKAIARRRNLSVRGVQSRTASIYSKLLPTATFDAKVDEMFSRRSLLLCEAVRNGLIEPDTLTMWKADLDQWLLTEVQNTNVGI